MPRKRRPLGPDVPFASNWWALRWISLLESFGWTSRLERGREYARAGNVLSLAIGEDGVAARVRGTAPEPYDVRIALRPLPARVFDRAIRAMAERATFAASLLAGRIPDDVESAFSGTGRTLLPENPDELKGRCTCADEADLCKHLAAVMYLLGERFDRDPFLIFLLRGMGRDALLTALRRHRTVATAAGVPVPPRAAGSAVPRESLPPVKPELFFKPLLPVVQLRTTFAPPEHPEAILTRLGPPPFADPEAASLLAEIHRAVGLGANERLEEWEWRRIGGRRTVES